MDFEARKLDEIKKKWLQLENVFLERNQK